MAASKTVYSTTPLAGLNLAFVGSAGSPSSGLPPVPNVLLTVFANDGHTYRQGKAASAIGSIATVKIGVAGSINTDAGSAGFTANAPGGAAIGMYLWAKKTTL